MDRFVDKISIICVSVFTNYNTCIIAQIDRCLLLDISIQEW